MDVRVRANSADRMHFILPPDPNAVLGDETLAAVHGGVRASSAGSVGSASTVGCAPSCASSAGNAEHRRLRRLRMTGRAKRGG